MIKIIKERIHQKHRTSKFPKVEPQLPLKFKGRPEIFHEKCKSTCSDCIKICPTDALEKRELLELNIGKCIFCGKCEDICAEKAIHFTQNYALSYSKKDDCRVKNSYPDPQPLADELLKLFGRSFRLREISAAGCNACEADTNVLGTLVFDLGRFGISFVASPRHADGILVTGPISQNMKLAVEKTYHSVADPKVVIAVGACAISGGIFSTHSETVCGVDKMIPVDLYIPGCPPHPYTILDGLLKVLKRR